jgi:2-methylisocitrate lyase-like PEP mutase family enzyme
VKPTDPDRLRRLLGEPGLLVPPVVWDGLGARLAEAAGFPMIFQSGACVAAGRLGGPDLDYVSMSEMASSLEMIRAAAPNTLLLADGDHGFGNAMNVQRTVRTFARAGASAILIEDKETPRPLVTPFKTCVSREEARQRVRAAIAAARETGTLILARTDARRGYGLDEALARISIFVEEGADIVFLDSPADRGEMRQAIAAARGVPSFAVLSPAPVELTQKEAAELGFKMAVTPFGLLEGVVAAMKDGLASLKQDGKRAGALTSPELQEILGYRDYEGEAARLSQIGHSRRHN